VNFNFAGPMDEETFKQRTKKVGLRVVKLVETLPRGRVVDVLANQLLRSETAIGAHYRAACRGKSVADTISKLGWVEEEADESLHWMEMLIESNYLRARRVGSLCKEIDEILAMTVVPIKTLRRRLNQPTVGNRLINLKSKNQNPKS
jgi:four helix bundle protein